jgi:hypothetical protein
MPPDTSWQRENLPPVAWRDAARFTSMGVYYNQSPAGGLE